MQFYCQTVVLQCMSDSVGSELSGAHENFVAIYNHTRASGGSVLGYRHRHVIVLCSGTCMTVHNRIQKNRGTTEIGISASRISSTTDSASLSKC